MIITFSVYNNKFIKIQLEMPAGGELFCSLRTCLRSRMPSGGALLSTAVSIKDDSEKKMVQAKKWSGWWNYIGFEDSNGNRVVRFLIHRRFWTKFEMVIFSRLIWFRICLTRIKIVSFSILDNNSTMACVHEYRKGKHKGQLMEIEDHSFNILNNLSPYPPYITTIFPQF